MINPKKLRFRLLILSIFIILFIIGFLKNHVFAFSCENAHSWNHSFNILCGGYPVEGNMIFANVNDNFLDGHQYRVFDNASLHTCLDGSTNQSRIYMDQAFYADGFSSGVAMVQHGDYQCPQAPDKYCDMQHSLWCNYTGGTWKMLTASDGAGYCGWWGLYTECDSSGNGPDHCTYQVCPAGKHLNTSCVCECDNTCNVAAQGGCQTRNDETCVCSCPAYSHVEGEQCVANGESMIFNPAVCGVCDPISQFGTFDIHGAGVYWMPFPNPPGVTLDMMFYGTDKGVANSQWECLDGNGGKRLLSITDSLLTYEELYPTLQSNCVFSYYTVPDFGGTLYRTKSTYVWFTGETLGVGSCDGINLSIHTKGFIGELKTNNNTESHGTMYHSTGHDDFKNRGRYGGGYEVHLP